ncbi:DUF5106 domain-containing protein [Anaerorudis cellulosivorans]|uniref:DUF5106 domain-containing protein n=1 Tax=Anaerorudis cellulosivorans TaxID=3397862 RepID=UPI00221EB8E3|nr:DUF5106 domain-containing protein [Seramator thermalis]MCW1734720.1 DUF5106 domain-containing protein [Seramator thermalis]
MSMKSVCTYFFLFFILGATACSSSRKASSNVELKRAGSSTQIVSENIFHLPQIPEDITSPEERGKFLVMHYWDRFDFSNERLISRPEITEQAFVDYIHILQNYVSFEDAKKSLHYTLKKMKENDAMHAYFASLFEKYLYEPNSPFRNEEFYLVVLKQLIKSSSLSKAEKSKYKFQLSMVNKNRVGKKAANFNYTLASGETLSLYSIKSDYLLLIFFDPECSTCDAVIRQIKESESVNNAMKMNSPTRTMLTVLTVYPGENLNVWLDYLPQLPAEWTNAYDQGMVITKKNLYDINAYPILYLLDKNKKVILKDSPLEAVEGFFSVSS